jgi:hypothetical protein
MNNKLIVCTEAPSFMGGMFSTEEQQKETHSQASELAKKYGGGKSHSKNPDFIKMYFHGKLEDDMGFDLVNAVGGKLPQLKVGDEIKCTAVLPDNKEVDATLYVGNRPNYYAGDNSGLYCLIQYSSEKFDKTNTKSFIWNK